MYLSTNQKAKDLANNAIYKALEYIYCETSELN
jgi:hypothetical protein